MFVFSNLAISIDGKIATATREHLSLGTSEDRRLMHLLRSRCDAVIQGASTLRAFKRPVLSIPGEKQPINVALSSALEGISPRWKFFTNSGTKKILFVSHLAPPSRIRKFADVAQIIQLKKPSRSSPIALQIVRSLARLGVRKLLVEGGGGLMWDFVEPGLIDEFYLTVTPRILGGVHAPTLVDGIGFTSKQIVNLKLKSTRRVGDELYLVYSRSRKRGS
jgi:5-amino-6-(5-phosphoribosylamino)uracil reductase